jgi:plastocyanin
MTNMQGSSVRIYGFVGLFVVAVLGGVALLAMNASSIDPPREVRLVARDMTFYVAGQDTPNPTLRFRAGETIRLVLRNEDPGMTHDFAVKSWKLASRLLEGKGETTLEFRVPDAAGTQTYSCTPHSRMMRGSIEVE